MSFEIKTTPTFERSAKALMKRYRSLKSDLLVLIASLEQNPCQGVELCPGLRKMRMAITSKGRGKSGGARVITFTVVAAEDEGDVFLIEIYDKADYSTVDLVKIRQTISGMGLKI